MSGRNGLVARLRGFASLQHGWDSYGAPGICRDAIHRAETYLLNLPSGATDVEVVPTTGGGVEIEYRENDGLVIVTMEFLSRADGLEDEP